MAAAVPPASYSCTPAPSDCNGWHRTNVVLKWFAPQAVDTNNCPIATLLSTEGVTKWSCGVTDDGITWVWALAAVSIDKTAPAATGATPARPPDGNGWYRAPIGVTFRGADAVSGISSCTTATYSRPDSAAASVTGTCTDVAGNRSVPLTFPLRYDATGPDVTRGRPGRRPDYRHWYNHPVTWHFRGRDRLSGLADCPPVVFRGPGGRAAHVIGACRDKAGNVSTRGFALRYDATPPPRPQVRAIPHDRSVHLRIRVRNSVRRLAIVRAPGVGGDRDSTLYSGRPRSFTDRAVRNGTHYRYTVIARDRAANRSRRMVRTMPQVRILAPSDGATVTAPPLLRWTPVRDADYYNVQLRRNGRKSLSIWPARPRLQLHARWRFAGRSRHLGPGDYSWEVWPGFGPRAAARYGRRIGRAHFVIPAAPPPAQ
jgi:hypothetical protein